MRAAAHEVAERLVRRSSHDEARELVVRVMAARDLTDRVAAETTRQLSTVARHRTARLRYYRAMDVLNVVVQLRNEVVFGGQ